MNARIPATLVMRMMAADIIPARIVVATARRREAIDGKYVGASDGWLALHARTAGAARETLGSILRMASRLVASRRPQSPGDDAGSSHDADRMTNEGGPAHERDGTDEPATKASSGGLRPESARLSRPGIAKRKSP
jgi:hypothetical protein